MFPEKAHDFDSSQLLRLASLYHLERYLFEVVSNRFAEQQTLTSYDFFAIIVWKSNRSKTYVRDGLAAAGTSPGELMREVGRAHHPMAKIETLLAVSGIGLPIASAILAVCYPDEFTVLDYRAWASLYRASVDGLGSHLPRSPEQYLEYCQLCKRLAKQAAISLRDLDRALWAKSWEDDLHRLIEAR
jgi:hypothetical protein